MDAKIDLEAREARDSRNLVSRKFDYSKNPRDEALRFRHVACEEESLRDRVSLIKNRRPRYHHASIGVRRAHLISAFITLQING